MLCNKKNVGGNPLYISDFTELVIQQHILIDKILGAELGYFKFCVDLYIL